MAQAVDITAEKTDAVAEFRDALSPTSRYFELTHRQRDVFDLLVLGLPDKAIAESLGMKVNTVRNHVQNILDRLEVHSRLEAVAVVRAAEN